MQLPMFVVKMYIIHCIVIMLHLTDSITPATPAEHTGLSSQSGVSKVPKDRSSLLKERMTVPRVIQKYANSLSFASTLPVRRKTLPLNTNVSKTEFRQPFSTLMGLKNATRKGERSAFKKVLNQQPNGKEKMSNYTTRYSDGETFEMVGQPLKFNSQENNASKINKGVNVSPNATRIRFGVSAGNGTPKIEWKARPPPSKHYKGISTTAQSGNIPLDEEIIVMGEPLIFTKEGPKVPDTLKHTVQDGIANYGAQSSNTSKADMLKSNSGVVFHNRTVPVKIQAHANGTRVQSAQVTSQSMDRADYLHNKTTIQNDTEVQLPHGAKHIRNNTHDYLPAKAQKNQTNIQSYQSAAQGNNASQPARQEEVDGYGAEDIADDFPHNNKSVNSSLAAFGEASLKPNASRLTSQTTEQNQTELIYDYGQQPNAGNYLDNSTNLISYQGNDTTEAYDDSENKGGNTNQLGNSQLGNPLFSPDFQEEERIDNSQSLNDDISNPEQNQETKDDEQLAGNQVTALSKQVYMPVDEFGSAFYGNETDDFFQREAIAAHNKYRAIHRAPPLKLSLELSIEAQNFANQLAKLGAAHHDTSENLLKEGEGDNVARGCSEWGGLTASGAAHRWYTQVCAMDWNKRTIQPNTKNFIQLIWKGTSHMGIGRAFGTRKGLPCTFIVARYRPGVINSTDLEMNIDKGLFLPSYCNADKDEGLMSTGFPSSFYMNSITQQRDQYPNGYQRPSSSSTAGGLPNGSPYLPLRTLERNIDVQDVRDLLNEEINSNAAYRFLPHINYAENNLNEGYNQDDTAMVGDEDDWKRSYRPRVKGGVQHKEHRGKKRKHVFKHVGGRRT